MRRNTYKLTSLYSRVQLMQMEFQRQLNEAMGVRDTYYKTFQMKYPTLPDALQQFITNDTELEITIQPGV